MTNPARQRRQARLAKIAQEVALKEGRHVDGHGNAVGSEYELLMAALAEDQRSLSNIKSNEAKAEYKAKAITKYQGWVEGVLEAGLEGKSGGDDDIFSTVFIWLCDMNEYAQALVMAEHMIKFEMKMPKQFNRDVATFILDAVSDAAIAGVFAQEEAIALLERVAELVSGIDIHDKAMAKFYKARGHALMGRLGNTLYDEKKQTLPNASQAYPLLLHAFDLDSSVGVKRDYEQLERFIKKENPERLEELMQQVQRRRQGKADKEEEEVRPAPEGAGNASDDENQPPATASTPSPLDDKGDGVP